ncbi:SUKH-4 family immunity protein [Streptomyces sp. SID3343]|uniref:SUKH-4 family immunity protein n=1 Tax=Streptomyces sp. SID3343 TaxID=2690260 RepID=UPI001370357A|nr:SUKH-4 family immunity protein [Streptomyces sp. SID3343]MYW01532.1 hypothetical protein [Streptomyces sp. SID3343]
MSDAVTFDEAATFLARTGPSGAAALLRLRAEPKRRPDGMLVLGEFEWFTHRRIVLDPATGHVYAQFGDPELLATSLDTFGRLIREVESFRTRDGGVWDPEVAARAALDRVRAYDPAVLETDGNVSGYWLASLLVWPLLYAVAPGRDGLRLDVTREWLASEFAAANIVAVDVDALADTIDVHPPSRRFLRDIGLVAAGPVLLSDERPLPIDAKNEEEEENGYEVPPDAGRYLLLGGLVHEFEVLLDSRDGRLHAWYYPDAELRPLNGDLSTLVFTQWMNARVNRYDREYGITHDYDGLAAVMTGVLSVLDPFAAEGDDAYWPGIFDDRHGGGLCG